MVRPCLPMSQPMPPPSVNPAIPVVETTPPVVANPWTAVARLNPNHVSPGSARATRCLGSTWMPCIGERSIMSPPSVTARPATPWPPPRTAISAPASRPRFTASITSAVDWHCAMSAGRLSIMPLCSRRASS